jgi:hypothetical protein
MSNDLVKRLRAGVNLYYGTGPCGLLNEAADHIEALEKALQDITDRLVTAFPAMEEYPPIQKARAALEGKDD